MKRKTAKEILTESFQELAANDKNGGMRISKQSV